MVGSTVQVLCHWSSLQKTLECLVSTLELSELSHISCVLSHVSCVRLFEILGTIAHQAPLSMGFSRQECWSGLPFPSPGGLPHPGIKLTSLTSPALAGGFFITSTTWEVLFTSQVCPFPWCDPSGFCLNMVLPQWNQPSPLPLSPKSLKIKELSKASI